jgi:hypothetical protein
MSNSTMVVLILVAIAAVVVIALVVKVQRSQKLKARFGPEYDCAVQETGSVTKAETKLEKLAHRVDHFKIVPLSIGARADFVAAWRRIQGRFVDDPKAALSEADQLIQKLMNARGYPVSDFAQRAADLSVDHPTIVENYRKGHDISLRHSQGRASTEDMRWAMIYYRTLFDELAEEPGVTSPTNAARIARA